MLKFAVPSMTCLMLLAGRLFADEKPAEPAHELKGQPLLFSDDFESGDLGKWEPTDPKAWKLEKKEDNQVYSLILRKSDFEPPVRSPYNRSLVKDLDVGSIVLDVKVQSTIPDYAHRDLCIFFGYTDDAHLYYVHLGKKAD